MGSSSTQVKDKPQKPKNKLKMPHQLKAEEVQQEAPVVEATATADCEDLAKAKEACLAGRGLQRPDGRLPEVHGGVEGGGGLGHLLLAVAPSANIHPDFYHCIYSFQHLLYIHADY